MAEQVQALDPDVVAHLATWNDRLADGEIFNGSVLALKSITIDRGAEHEQPGLRLRFIESDYVTQRATTCITAEGMNRDDVRSGSPDPILCAARGLHEELGIRLSSSELSEIRLSALTLNLDWWEWNLLGQIRLADLRGHAPPP